VSAEDAAGCSSGRQKRKLTQVTLKLETRLSFSLVFPPRFIFYMFRGYELLECSVWML
jgi:hypothetical protein